jgi:hypothetical protein
VKGREDKPGITGAFYGRSATSKQWRRAQVLSYCGFRPLALTQPTSPTRSSIAGVDGHLNLPAGGQWVPNEGHYGLWSGAKREVADAVAPGPGDRDGDRSWSDPFRGWSFAAGNTL